MIGIPVYFRFNNDSEDYAFRRLLVLPRVGESVEFDGVSFMVLQLIHKLKLGTVEQPVYVYIKEVK